MTLFVDFMTHFMTFLFEKPIEKIPTTPDYSQKFKNSEKILKTPKNSCYSKHSLYYFKNPKTPQIFSNFQKLLKISKKL
jgi:hypothetical protein